jgi:hypothetical protein
LEPLSNVSCEGGKSYTELTLEVPALFRLPGAPADAAAARAALAGVTRLEAPDGLLEPAQLAAALLHLPGLRDLSLTCDDCAIGERGAAALGSDLVAVLAACPGLESLEWDLEGWCPEGASGWGCWQRRRDGQALGASLFHRRWGASFTQRRREVPALQPSHRPCAHDHRLPLPTPSTLNPPADNNMPVPLLSGDLPAALPALTSLRVSCCQDANLTVSGLTRLRRLTVQASTVKDQTYTPVEGLSGLTALEELCLQGDNGPLARPSDLAPLTALTRLAIWCLPPELASHRVAARLRRLQLQAIGVLQDAPGGGDGSGANGAAAAALAALARGAPLLERLCIRVGVSGDWDEPLLMCEYPGDVELGAPLGPDAAWPSLAHLEVTPWAALLLARCAFPRLSRLTVSMCEAANDSGIAPEQLRTAAATLAAKARDHVALLVDDCGHSPSAVNALAAAAAVPGLRHLSWKCSGRFWRGGIAAPPPSDWARLAASLESLELSAPLSILGYAEPLAALTGLTHLSLDVVSEDATSAPRPAQAVAGGAWEGGAPPLGPAGSAPARAARALARLPRLTHLRVTYPAGKVPEESSHWGRPGVAAQLARCPALRLLEIDCRYGPLWRHEREPPCGAAAPLVPRPSSAWPPFCQALRAGGCGATVRPVPDDARDRHWMEV